MIGTLAPLLVSTEAAGGAPMELDLDSFLRSHPTDSDSDDCLSPSVRRTVDDILNDTDSDSSTSSPSSPSAPGNLSGVAPAPAQKIDRGASSISLPAEPEIVEEATAKFAEESKKTAPYGRRASGDFSGSVFSVPARGGNSRVLPQLLGILKVNPRPGAALAAAAAASRSVPTPHAAAIKFRRANGELSQKLGFTRELEDSAGDGDGEMEAQLDSVSDASGSLAAELGGKLRDNEEKLELSSNSGELEKSDIEGVSGREEEVYENLGECDDSSFHREAAIANEDDEAVGDATLDQSNSDEIDDINEETNSLLLSNKNVVEVDATSASPSCIEDNVGIIDSENLTPMNDIFTTPITEIHDFERNDSVENEDGGISLVMEDANSRSEANDVIEDLPVYIENYRKSGKRTGKRNRSLKKPLEIAEELEKRYASSGLHWEEGAAAQPMKLEGIQRGPPAVGYLQIDPNNTISQTIASQAFKRDHGTAQVLAVHMNFIAVGMSRGFVLVMPSKYSAHYPDNMDSKMLMLGTSGEKSPVTSMCFNPQGDLLLAGYGDGHITVWDVLKATVLKTITGEHKAPIVHILFMGQETQVTRQFKAVTGDSKGHVLLHVFSVVPLLNRVTIKTQWLLDGHKTSTVLSASALVVDDYHGMGSTTVHSNATSAAGGLGGRVGGVVGGEAGWKLFGEGSSIIEEGVVVFVTNQTILVVRLTTLEKYAHLPRPEGVREGSMPYTAWKFRGYPRVSSNEPTTTEASDNGSLLAVAWDRKIQVYKFVKSEVKVYREWNLDNPAIGVAWLDDQMLVILTSRGQICLFAKDGIEIHRTSLIEHGGDEMVAYHTYFTNIFGNPEKAYHNSVAVRGATIYLLGPTNLVVSRLLPWKERIQVLQRAGDWMGALDMAMRLYDGHAHGVIDLPRTVEAIQDAIMPYLEELIISYVDEVFSYISLAFSSQTGKEQEDIQKTNSVQSESEDKYARVGGVAVEFCVHIKRIDILFDDIFSKFAAVKQGGTFLELLEPYILKDMLGCLPPEIMQALVEHYSNKGWLLRVEQCVLHMDISSLDFNQVVRLCREHGLHGALIYLFNRGLNDYRAPLEELLAVVINSHRKDAAPIGYRMLVYIKYCFSGLAFPPGHGTLAPSRLPSLRVELLQFLLEDSNVLNLQVGKSFKSLNGSCPNLSHLLWLDTEATLEVLRCAFTDDIMLQKVHSSNGLDDASTENAENNFQALEDLHIMVQNTVNTLIQVLDVQISEAISSSGTNVDELLEVWPSKKDIGHLLEFTSYFVSCKGARVSKGILNQILRYLTSDLDHLSSIASQNVEAARKREKEVLALLTVAPQTDWDSFHLLQLCEKAQFYQVCGFIHKMQGQYVDALDSYMKDVDEPIHAFAFISSKLLLLENSELLKFQTAVKDRIPQLISLSREGTLFLVFNHFSEERHHIFSTLQAFPKCLFFYLKTIIEVSLSGTLNFSCFGRAYAPDAPKVTGKRGEIEAYLEGLSKLPKLLQHNSVQLTDEMVELYLELLCQYERNSVLKFLETFENYRLEHCLRLCLDYEVTDAAAFLLERVGDVGNALSLIMSDLSKKLQFLDVALEKRTSETPSSFSEMEQLEDILRMEEVKNLLDLLHASISLCQRNAPRLDSHESESLWFRLLDWFCQPLSDLYDDKRKYSKGRKSGKVLIGTLDPKNENDTSMYRWKMSKFQKSAHILQRILSQFIREVIEGMVGYVPLPTIMSKLLSDNGCHEFGDFKLTILGMLGTYSFERRILDTAKSLIEDDTFYTMSLLKKGASHAYVPNSFVCCVCGSSLTKNSSKSSIRVFNCGHASHLQCEFGNGELSQDSNAECPICVPKKNRRSKSKAIPESGLIESHISRDPPATGTGILQNGHEFDTAEKPYGLQQMSRFEMLKNLGKSDRPLQTESVPLLRLAPPAIYHEKVKRATDLVRGESNYAPPVKHEQPSRMKAARDLRTKASSLHFPKKGSIFGDYINRKRGDM